ncbi:MAG TPA: tetratricopeptide repeat protein [Bryobacteraceae bacterium]|nr:tetratricopeptide repeat protein [Bryobacteraceae bacterium]
MRFPALVLAISALLFASQSIAAQTPAPTFSSLAQQAQTARDAHQLDKALDLYKKALKLKPNWEEGLGNVGSIAYDLDQYKDCVWAFNKLSESKPDAAPAWTMAGLCEYKLRNYGSALDDLTQVEKLGYTENPELARAARLHYALMLTKAGRFEKAIVVLTELTRIDKKTPEISAAAGIAGLRQPWVPGEVPESQRDLVYRLGDAMATAMERDYKDADQKFVELLQTYPSEPNVHFRYGALLYVQDGDRGIEEIKKAVALDPNHVPALVSLSAIALKRDDQKAALEYGEMAVKAGPADFTTHVVLGRALLASQQTARAVTELQQAVKLAPNDPDAHFSLATAYRHLGRKDDAIREQNEFKRLEHLGGN